MFFFFQAEDGIRDLVRSRGLGDVYKRQGEKRRGKAKVEDVIITGEATDTGAREGTKAYMRSCLLYTSDAADDLLCVDLGGRRIIKKKKNTAQSISTT